MVVEVGAWLIAVNEQGTKPPIVFFHTWDNEADHLRRLGCDTAQGWYYARPGPPDRLHDLLLVDAV